MDDPTGTAAVTSPPVERPPRVDVVVVGAGLAGATAAAIAARAGCSVWLLDAHGPGGRARTVERDGYLLNEGGHALYERGPGATLLRELGIEVPGGAPPLAEYRTWWDGEVQVLPVSPAALLTTPLLGARSKLAVGRLFGAAARVAAAAGGRSFGEWMDGRGLRSDAQRYLSTLARLSTYAAEPELAPADVVLRQLALAGGGVRYVDGGWGRIVDGLLAAVRSAGGRIAGGTPVTSVARDGGDWVVEAVGSRFVARSVVIAAGSPAVAEALVDRRPGWTDLAGPPVRAACLDVGMTVTPPVSFLFSADDPSYLSAHAPTARLAPAGHRLYSVMRYLRSDEHLGRDAARAELERHAARAGLAPRGDRTIDRFLHDMVVSHGSPVVDRPRPRGDELAGEGLHVAGDWVGDHLLADASFASGVRAGRAVAARRVATV